VIGCLLMGIVRCKPECIRNGKMNQKPQATTCRMQQNSTGTLGIVMVAYAPAVRVVA